MMKGIVFNIQIGFIHPTPYPPQIDTFFRSEKNKQGRKENN